MPLSKNATNKEIAEAFRQVADVYEINGKDLFHIRAYRNAANSIELLAAPLKELWTEGRLDEVPGLGEKFIRYLSELFHSGKIRHFTRVLNTQPPGFYSLLEVPGIGPKTAQKLTRQLHLTRAGTAVKKLREALKSKKTLEISPKIKEKLLSSIKYEQTGAHRLLINEAEYISKDILDYLKKSPNVLECEGVGSLRRKAATIGDVDIAVSTKEPEQVVTYLKKFEHIKKVISTGEKQTSFIHTSGVHVDVKTQDPNAWGSMLQHYTGSKLHNIQLRTLAKEKGLSLSENGIKAKGKTVPYADETSFYKALGLQKIPPELREGRGEIEAAKKQSLPKLLEVKDIRGDFHIHTSIDFPSSHDLGISSIDEILTKAHSLRYEYIGLSDHNPKQSGMSSEERLKIVQNNLNEINKQVDAFSKKAKGQIPHVFKGFEVDILPDGKLALEDEATTLLDYMIVSVHSQFSLPRDEMTQRILRGLSNPKAKILGHPTGRQLGGVRNEIQCNWEEIFSFCAKNDKAIEINATPQRLDLPDTLVREAASYGIRFVINTDSHNIDQMDFMKYGVWIARRGWCGNKHILNTRPLQEITHWLTT